MDSFGAALKAVRGEKSRTDVARDALGDVPATEIKSFANYIYRIERGDEPGVANPSLDLMQQLAKGLGYMKLTEFFSALEGVPTLLDPTPQKGADRTLQTAVESDTSKADSNGAQVPPHAANAIDIATLSGAILEAANHIASACDRLATAVATANQHGAVHRQAAKPRTQSTKRRRADPGRVRKSA